MKEFFTVLCTRDVFCASMDMFADEDSLGGRTTLPHAHYRLTSGHLLNRLMRCPDTGGIRHTVRSIADASGVGKSKISNMLNGRQMTVTTEQALAIAEAVDIPLAALFTPLVSTFKNTPAREADT